jgi:[protein-PII] uridylyltransferase
MGRLQARACMAYSPAMEAIRDQRAIIDRRQLSPDLAEAGPRGDAQLLDVLKQVLSAGRAEIRRRFEGDARSEQAGINVGRETCFLMDQLIRALYDHTIQYAYPIANPSAGEHLALVALGGYGRGELAPFSDIDLLFLLPYKLTPHGEQVVEFMLYRLWDLGLKVGHATRSVDDCIRLALSDMTIRTGLLESRFLWGDQTLYQELKQRFRRDVVAGTGPDFVEAKLAERDQRHQRNGNSRYSLEPNIKEGKGGLRDLHTLFWIAKYVYQVDDIASLVDRSVLTPEEAATFEKAAAFLWTLRCHLHYLADRAEERLTFDLQPELARRIGYTDHAGTRGVERLMKHYFLVAKSVGDLTRIFCAAIEAAHQRKPFLRLPTIGLRRRDVEGFPVEGGRLSLPGPAFLTQQPVNILRLFEVAQRRDLDIHPAALRLVTRHLKLVKGLRHDPEANRLFVAMLTSPKGPEAILRRLNEAGVFGRFIPDFGRVVAQMQYDMYHHYTVDEHTLFAIGILHRIEQGALKDEAPIASAVVHQVLSRRVLYLAVLLHDIAKGRGGDHSELGAEIALQLGPRLGFSAEETEQVAWLVMNHLLMSNTAFKRDIDDPQTVENFAGQVQSLERLRLLLVLTVADIRAVGPKTWNNWKATLLRELYWQTEEKLSGGLAAGAAETRVSAATTALAEHLGDWSAAEIEQHMGRGHSAYWLGFDTGRGRRRPACHRDPRRCRPRLHGCHGLCRRPAGAARASGRRARACRRGYRGCAHLHPQQRQGAGQFHHPGCRRRLRAARQAGAPGEHHRACAGCRRRKPGAGIAGLPLAQPLRRFHRGAPRADRQPGECRPYGGGGERPRSQGPVLSPDPCTRRTQAADRQRQGFDVRRPRRRRLLRQGSVRPEDRG